MTALTPNKPVSQTIPNVQAGTPSNTTATDITKKQPRVGMFGKKSSILSQGMMEGTPVNKTKLGGS